MGLGTSPAKWFVEAHGGCIDMESLPEKGVTLSLILLRGRCL